MRRLLLLSLALTLALGGAMAQTPTFDTFKSTFVSFADSMAGGLNLNSTLGNNWSDAYLGGFPHLGAGVFVGSTFAGKDATNELFGLFGQTPPTGLDQLGVPVPALGAMAKIGLPFIPIDVGLKAGLIPASVGQSLEAASGVQAEYKNVGLSLRYALVKENLLLPDLSFGLSGNYLSGRVSAPVGSGASLTFNDGTYDYVASFSDPRMALEWETKTLDATLQVSKTLLFIRPYAGLGYTIGSSTVRGGVDSAISVTYNGSPSSVDALRQAIIDAGGTPPDLTATGFSYSTDSNDPSFRVYGGVSLSLLITLDAQLMYVPKTKNLGAALSARLQL